MFGSFLQHQGFVVRRLGKERPALNIQVVRMSSLEFQFRHHSQNIALVRGSVVVEALHQVSL